MDTRVAARLKLHLALRQREDPSADSATPWFYIVDLEATAEESSHALRDGRVVLGFSATEADADAATNAEGLGVVYHTDLDEAEQRDMAARIYESQGSAPERAEAPETNEER